MGEIDGPNPGSFARSFQNDPEISRRLLAAAVPAHVDVRMTVASVLRERAIDYDTVVAMTPEVLAEENSAVRAGCMMARARSARGSPEATERLTESLMSELNATGSYMNVRRRAALAGLLELGVHEKIASTFAEHRSPKWTHCLVERLDRDPVSIGALVEHWGLLQPLLEQHTLQAELPVAEIVFAGYDALLEQTLLGQHALDRYFETPSQDFINSSYFDAFARRQPKSAFLRSTLLRFLSRAHSGDITCAAARLLSKHFSSNQDIWPELSTRLGSPEEAAPNMAAGVLGYLALGWPDGMVAAWVRSLRPDQRTQWSARDRLLIASMLKDVPAAEAVIAEMVSEPLDRWRYRMEDTHALRIWAESEECVSSLVRWIESDNSSLSLTAISLVANSRRDLRPYVDQLIGRFNAQLTLLEGVPADGLDAAVGRQTTWVAGVYSALKPIFTTTT